MSGRLEDWGRASTNHARAISADVDEERQADMRPDFLFGDLVNDSMRKCLIQR